MLECGARSELLSDAREHRSWARAEILNLLESQLNTLEKQTFGVVTEAELCEYEDRYDRIRQLYAQIIDIALSKEGLAEVTE